MLRVRTLLPLLLPVLTAPLLAAPQDAFEDNDTCATPALIAPGLTLGLSLESSDDDFYLVPVPANADVRVSATTSLGALLDVELYDVGCGAPLATSTQDELRYFDCGGAARDLVVRIPAGAGPTVDYDLAIEAVELVDDPLEDNDDCSNQSVFAVSTFTTRDLIVTECDRDYYIVRLQPSATTAPVQIELDVLFSHADSDVDVNLWDLGCNNLLASSTTQTDNESIRFANPVANQPMGVVIEVLTSGGQGWAEYSLTVCFALNDSVGNQICPGVVNSTGRPATLCGRGDDSAVANDLRFYVVDLPMNSTGFFITATAPDYVPAAGGPTAIGDLCLSAAGGIGRYNFAPQFTANGNAAFYQPDLTQTPVAGAFTAVLPGDTRYWQYWYRDAVGGSAVSNLSSALRIEFQ